MQKQQTEADPPFDSAQGRLFVDDDKKAKQKALELVGVFCWFLLV
jgi:hypothetical protein